ncbi:hypothetical protein CEXT_400271 [Caerostris extrusa]|uniref:Uncharacterized protein n=1 Tax=Caerostris extrusa TaxID=172846 RepID=A0AAV4Q775_CAEEX|nr:hypothetical protein CEXT_400271 [Caerostris extrusa]
MYQSESLERKASSAFVPRVAEMKSRKTQRVVRRAGQLLLPSHSEKGFLLPTSFASADNSFLTVYFIQMHTVSKHPQK